MKRDAETKFSDDICICGNKRNVHPIDDRQSTCLGFFFYSRSDDYMDNLWNKAHQLIRIP